MHGYVSPETVEQAARDAAYANAGGSMPSFVQLLPTKLRETYVQAYNAEANKPKVCARRKR